MCNVKALLFTPESSLFLSPICLQSRFAHTEQISSLHELNKNPSHSKELLFVSYTGKISHSIQLLEEVKSISSTISVVFIATCNDIQTANLLIKKGALDFVSTSSIDDFFIQYLFLKMEKIKRSSSPTTLSKKEMQYNRFE